MLWLTDFEDQYDVYDLSENSKNDSKPHTAQSNSESAAHREDQMPNPTSFDSRQSSSQN